MKNEKTVSERLISHVLPQLFTFHFSLFAPFSYLCISKHIDPNSHVTMSSPYFRFRQFTVWHDRSSLRVGTDGVLIGAWAGRQMHPSSILDAGTGSGLIALMMAQRFPDSVVRAIDIDAASVAQARDNIAASPWAGRIVAEQADFNQVTGEFDLIVSNPPYFDEDTAAATTQRNQAKHTVTLSFTQLISKSAQLLTAGGRLAVILPHAVVSGFIGTAATHGLCLARRCDVRGSEQRPPRRTMLEFAKNATETDMQTLVIRTATNEYTDDYRRLTADFYL